MFFEISKSVSELERILDPTKENEHAYRGDDESSYHAIVERLDAILENVRFGGRMTNALNSGMNTFLSSKTANIENEKPYLRELFREFLIMDDRLESLIRINTHFHSLLSEESKTKFPNTQTGTVSDVEKHITKKLKNKRTNKMGEAKLLMQFAVEECGLMLKYASDDFKREHPTVVDTAIKNDRRVFPFSNKSKDQGLSPETSGLTSWEEKDAKELMRLINIYISLNLSKLAETFYNDNSYYVPLAKTRLANQHLVKNFLIETDSNGETDHLPLMREFYSELVDVGIRDSVGETMTRELYLTNLKNIYDNLKTNEYIQNAEIEYQANSFLHDANVLFSLNDENENYDQVDSDLLFREYYIKLHTEIGFKPEDCHELDAVRAFIRRVSENLNIHIKKNSGNAEIKKLLDMYAFPEEISMDKEYFNTIRTRIENYLIQPKIHKESLKKGCKRAFIQKLKSDDESLRKKQAVKRRDKYDKNRDEKRMMIRVYFGDKNPVNSRDIYHLSKDKYKRSELFLLKTRLVCNLRIQFMYLQYELQQLERLGKSEFVTESGFWGSDREELFNMGYEISKKIQVENPDTHY